MRRLTTLGLRRTLVRISKRLSLQAKIYLLLATGAIAGVILASLLVWLFSLFTHRASISSETESLVRCSIASHYNFKSPPTKTYVFSFTTGRSGTQHLSRVLKPIPNGDPVAYITHQEEHLSIPTKEIVDREYRRLAASPDEQTFNRTADVYVKKIKIPFYNQLLHGRGATRLVYTGHLPMAFGLGPSLIRQLPRGSVRILRLRRDRIATAVSLMALGPEHQDPWGATIPNQHGQVNEANTMLRRWFPVPTDAMVRLQVDRIAWKKLNRFQRWLWYVDDIECRWQALLQEFGTSFSWMEESLEQLQVLDGGKGWERVAKFMGVSVDLDKVGVRDNSIEQKKRSKIDASESQLREWDIDYRHIVGGCQLSDSQSYAWNDYNNFS